MLHAAHESSSLASKQLYLTALRFLSLIVLGNLFLLTTFAAVLIWGPTEQSFIRCYLLATAARDRADRVIQHITATVVLKLLTPPTPPPHPTHIHTV